MSSTSRRKSVQPSLDSLHRHDTASMVDHSSHRKTQRNPEIPSGEPTMSFIQHLEHLEKSEKEIYLFNVYLFHLHVSTCTTCVPTEAEDGLWFPGTGVKACCQPPWEFWELNPSTLQEQPGLWATAEPSLKLPVQTLLDHLNWFQNRSFTLHNLVFCFRLSNYGSYPCWDQRFDTGGNMVWPTFFISTLDNLVSTHHPNSRVFRYSQENIFTARCGGRHF